MVAAAALLGLVFSAVVSAAPLNRRWAKNYWQRLVVFGDSFSDDGEGAWRASNGTWPADPAYVGHSFSNGPVWPEYLTANLNISLFDYAAGGATSGAVAGYTGPNSSIPVPSSQVQINEFLSTQNTTATDLFVIYIGANDFFFNSTINGTQVAQRIDAQIQQLYNSSAQGVLLATYPNLAAMPAAAFDTAQANQILEDQGDQLYESLMQLQKKWSSKIHISVVDVHMLFVNVFRYPKKYGMNPQYLHTACLEGAYAFEKRPRKLCTDPDSHIFFDIYHPTTVMHAYVAALFEKALGT